MKSFSFRYLVVLAILALLFVGDIANAQCGGRGAGRRGLFGGGFFGGRASRMAASQGCGGGEQQYQPQYFQYPQRQRFYQYRGDCSNGQCSVVLQNPRLTYLARINATPAPAERPYFASR